VEVVVKLVEVVQVVIREKVMILTVVVEEEVEYLTADAKGGTAINPRVSNFEL
jgi:hypothetical protein